MNTSQFLLDYNYNASSDNYEACLVAIGLAYSDTEKAMDLLKSVLVNQDENGFIPKVADEKNVVLPIIGTTLLNIYNAANDKKKITASVEELYPKVQAFHHYLYENRDVNEEGIIAVSAAETPIAAASDYSILCPYFNALLIASNEAMIELGRLAKQDVTDFVLWNDLSVYTVNEKLWSEENGCYQAIDLDNGEAFLQNNHYGWLPMIADIPTLEMAEGILKNIGNNFQAGNNIDNWFLWQGLIKFEMIEMAERIKASIQSKKVNNVCDAVVQIRLANEK